MCKHCQEPKKPKKYLTDYPELMKEYDREANKGLDPSKLTHGLNKKIWWICSLGHRYEAIIHNRVRSKCNSSCPYCSNHKVLKGFNDLATVYPQLALEWSDKNKLQPTEVVCGTGKKYWWKCSLGHEWQTSILHRIYNSNCPYCSNQKVLKGFNDLATIYPDIAKEWDNNANGNLKPTEVAYGSGKKVHWICSFGHKWIAKVSSRTKDHHGCPHCSRSSSLPEFAIKYYLEQLNLNVIHNYHGSGFELDLYIQDLKVAIEYDGYYWHQHKLKQDIQKNQQCHDLGITLYRIREDLPTLNDYSIDIVYLRRKESLSNPIKKLINYIKPNNSLHINYDKDENIIYELKGDHLIRPKSKLLTICNVTRNYTAWSKYFGHKGSWITQRINRNGFNETIQYLTKLYKEKQENNCFFEINKKAKYIEIDDVIKNYSQWCAYFKRSDSYISQLIKNKGLPETINYLTKLYREKQEKENLLAA